MKDIEALKELQKIDIEIFKVKNDLLEKPKASTAIETEFTELSLRLKELEGELKKMQLVHKEKELDLQTKEEAVNKQKTQLFQVKTNKEYNALQLEIEKLLADNSLLEEDIINILEKIDTLKQSIDKEKAKLEIDKKKLEQTKAGIELDIKELQEKLTSLNAARKRAMESNISPKVLSLYERILENKGELAIVPVKDNTCSGCFMAIRPQVVNELCLGKLLTCETCARILYVESDD